MTKSIVPKYWNFNWTYMESFFFALERRNDLTWCTHSMTAFTEPLLLSREFGVNVNMRYSLSKLLVTVLLLISPSGESGVMQCSPERKLVPGSG